MVESVTIAIAFQDSDIEAWLRSQPPRRLLDVADLLIARNLQLRAVHPGSTDVALARWFAVEVPADQAEDVLAELRAAPAVASAFVKPPDALPA